MRAVSRLSRVNWFTVAVAFLFILFAAWALFGQTHDDSPLRIGGNICDQCQPCQEKPWPKNLTLSGVRIYFPDRTVDVRSLEEWKEVPSDDVQVVVAFFKETYLALEAGGIGWEEPYRFLCHSEDFYWWGGCGNAEQAFKYSQRGTVKLGRWMLPVERWEELYRKAEADKVSPK